MDFNVRDSLAVQVTLVSNEFIDRYMAAANGEYVKVYLYFLRHGGGPVDIPAVADALNHTEADVKRAIAYWERAGVLRMGASMAAGQEKENPESQAEAKQTPDPVEGREERMRRLSGDEEFSTLLYAAQQYLGKVFTSLECEKFAYFYDALHMSGELLEFLSEYCAQNGHTSIRYIEKVALNWYELGITTKAAAKDYTLRFSKNMSSVMKTFGLTNRNPGTAEQELMKKWFYTYGFDRRLVLEACDRTLKATQTPSFQYADKILTEWKNSGVKTMQDVETLDKNRRASKPQSKDTKEKAPARKAAANRFHNFEERSYDYEDSVWEEIRSMKKGGASNGTQ